MKNSPTLAAGLVEPCLPDWLPDAPASDDAPNWLPDEPTPSPRSFVRILDDETQEATSAPRLTAVLQVPIRQRVGRPLSYGVAVRNPRSRPIHAVQIEHEVPLGLRFLGADPQPRRRGRRLVWSASVMEPDAAHRLRLNGVAAGVAGVPLPPTATFEVSYVQESGLLLSVTGPRQMRLGEQAVLKLRVHNAGRQTASAPMMFCRLSSTALGAKVERLETKLAPIAPGEVRAVNLATQVRKPGTLQCLATVIATGWPEVSARLEIRADFGAAMMRGGRAAAEGVAKSVAERGERHVVFGLAGTECALPMTHVVEVNRLPPLTPVPNVPDWTLGVAALRGEVISLVDLRRFLGLSPNDEPERGRMIVLRSSEGEMTVGLVVDRVAGMRPLRPLDGECDNPVLAPYASGVGESGGSRLTVLDADRILFSPLMQLHDA